MRARPLARDSSDIRFDDEAGTPKKPRVEDVATPTRLIPFPGSPANEEFGLEDSFDNSDSLPCFEEADMNECCKKVHTTTKIIQMKWLRLFSTTTLLMVIMLSSLHAF